MSRALPIKLYISPLVISEKNNFIQVNQPAATLLVCSFSFECQQMTLLYLPYRNEKPADY
jgi:hypothetical protein